MIQSIWFIIPYKSEKRKRKIRHRKFAGVQGVEICLISPEKYHLDAPKFPKLPKNPFFCKSQDFFLTNAGFCAKIRLPLCGGAFVMPVRCSGITAVPQDPPRFFQRGRQAFVPLPCGKIYTGGAEKCVLKSHSPAQSAREETMFLRRTRRTTPTESK